MLKHLVKDIIVTYNQDEKYHNLKANLTVPLIMDIDQDAQARRSPLWGGERVKASRSSKPKSGLDYSTVTDLAKFLGWSTLHPLITAM